MTVFGWLNGRCPFGIESIAPKGSVAILFLGSTGFGPTSDSINCFQVVVKRPAAGHIVGTIGPSLSATRCLVLFFFSNIFFIRTRHAFTHLLTVIILASHQPPFLSWSVFTRFPLGTRLGPSAGDDVRFLSPR